MPGFAALALYWPEDGITVVILTNQSPAPDPRQLVEAVHRLASGRG